MGQVQTPRRSVLHPTKRPWCFVTGWPRTSPGRHSTGLCCSSPSMVGHGVLEGPLSPFCSQFSGWPSLSGYEIGLPLPDSSSGHRLTPGTPSQHRLPHLSVRKASPFPLLCHRRLPCHCQLSLSPGASTVYTTAGNRVLSTSLGTVAMSTALSFTRWLPIFMGSLGTGTGV